MVQFAMKKSKTLDLLVHGQFSDQNFRRYIPMANKWVYMFSEGDMTMRNLLGGKGANLAEMTSIGLPVPQGFTITTEACTQ